jgi:hypothetical protein
MTFIPDDLGTDDLGPPRRGLRVWFSAAVRMAATDMRDCLLTAAASAQWGGQWRATDNLIQHFAGSMLTVWRTSADARMVMTMFDNGELFPYLSVIMTRGDAISSAEPWPDWEPAERRKIRAVVWRLMHPGEPEPAGPVAQPVAQPIAQPVRVPLLMRVPVPVAVLQPDPQPVAQRRPVPVEPARRDAFADIVAHLADLDTVLSRTR